MGSRVARFAPLLVVAALGAASCGGGDSAPLTGATTDSTASSIDSPVVNDAGVIADELTSGILEAVGVDSAFAAVLYALDAGYSVGQLADAARDGTITPTGTIDGIEPAGPPLGLITPPAGPTGFAWRALARPATPDETGGPRTPEQVQAAIDRKLLTAVTRQALEEPWMLIPETDVADEFPAGPNPSVEATKVMITAIVSLIDVGYSFDQALNGWLFGEWDVGMGVLPDGTVLNGCIGIRAPDGSLVRPTAAMVNGMGSETIRRCGAALRQGDVVFDPDEIVDSVFDDDQAGGSAAGGSATAGDLTLNGRYEGELDVAALYATLSPELVSALTVSENVVVAEADDGRLVSLTGALSTYNPEIVLDGGGICENDARIWFDAETGSATATGDGFEVPAQWSSYEQSGDCGGFSPEESSETGTATIVGRLDQQTGAVALEIEFFPEFVLSAVLVAAPEGTTPPPGSNPTATTTTTTPPAPGFSFTASESDTFAGRFRGEREAAWSGTYAVQDSAIIGSGTVSGLLDGECSDSLDGPFSAVSLTFTGSYRITGSVSSGVAHIRLVTDPATVDLAVGDTTKACVEQVVRLGETTAQFPIGSTSPAGAALELPAEGGTTRLEHPGGMVIEVTVASLE